MQRCRACGRAHHYPRPFCPHCWSEELAWEQASGRATLYSWSVVRRHDLPPFDQRVPYVAAVVDLEEGVRMVTDVVGCPFEDLAIGMALEVEYERRGEALTLPVFRRPRAA